MIGCFAASARKKASICWWNGAAAVSRPATRAKLIFTGRVTADNQKFFDEQQAKIAAAGLSDRIRVLGRNPGNVNRWCGPIRRWTFRRPRPMGRAFGLTPLEAMACGVPTVAARVGAYEALIRDGETGSLVPRDDADALTAALARWLDDDAAREAAGRTAPIHVQNNHAIEGEARAIVEVYRKLLA